MSYDEVVAEIGPISLERKSWNCALTLPFCTRGFDVGLGLDGFGVAEFLDFSTDLYTLVFMSQRMYKKTAE